MTRKVVIGRVQQAIMDAFDVNPETTFDTAELCALVFPGVVPEKKHTVSVLRAARSLAADYFDYQGFPVRWLGNRADLRTVIYVYAFNVRSYALGKLRAHFHNLKPVAECLAILDDPTSEPYALAQPGGYWALQVERIILLSDGRDKEAAAVLHRLEEIRRQDAAAAVGSAPEAMAA